MKTAGIELNRKSLSDLAVFEPDAFSEVVSLVKKGN
jgi:ribosomal protein L20